MLELGGNINLSGFKELDKNELNIVKKIVGNYGKKFSELSGKFESLNITVKGVHKTDSSEKKEVHVKIVDNGKAITSEVTDMNLFSALGEALRKVEDQMSKS